MDQPPEEEGTGKKIEWALPDLLKRGLLAGVGALFMTEEGIRSLLGELKLPKDAVQFVVNQVSRTKEDLFRMISREIREFLQSTNLGDELRRVLSSTSLEISTTVRFVDLYDSLQPKVKSKVRIKSNRKKEAV